MKRWLKRAGWGIGLVLLAMIGFVAVEHARGQWQLNRHLQALRRNGEQLSVAPLEPKRSSADHNAALDVVALTNRLESLRTNLDMAPPSLRFGAPGRAVVSWRLERWNRDRKTTNTWSQLEPWHDHSQELLNLLHGIARKPEFDDGFDYQKGFLDFPMPQAMITVKRVAQVLDLAAICELRQGRLDAAGEHTCDLVKLVAVQSPEPLIICQLIRQACAGIAFTTTWQALQAPGWNDEQLAALQAAWARCDFLKDMIRALEMERAITLEEFGKLKHSRQHLAAYLQKHDQASDLGLPDAFLTHGAVLKWIHVPLWRAAWADQDEVNSLERWQKLIERARMVHTNSWAALPNRLAGNQAEDTMPFLALFKEPGEQNWYDRLRFLFSNEPFGVSDGTIRTTLFSQAQQQMAVSAIALKRYQLRTGKLPADLNALVPDYLPTLPRDPMDGKALRYRVLPGGGFLLYSVGEDGKDDGGNPAPRSGTESMQMRNGLDFVWPAPATPEEAAAAAAHPAL